MAGKLVEDVKFLHGGIAVQHLRVFGEIFERELKLPGQVDYGRKCAQGIGTFYRELQSVKTRQRDNTQDDAGLMRAVLIYSKEFFEMFSRTNQEEARRVAELLVECLNNGFMAELLIDSSLRQTVDDFYTQCGVPRQARPIDSSNYIPNMDNGALTEAIFQQWFGNNAKLSDVFGGAEAMDVDDDAYKPDEVRIIHYGLNREDTLRPLGRAFEDDVGISGQATYETYKKRNKHPSDVILKDMRKVKSDIDEQTHGVLMWNGAFIGILQERPEAWKSIEDLLENDTIAAEGCCRQFANVLMTDIDLSQFQAFSPALFRILAQPNRVVRLKNCLGKDQQSINFQDLSRAIYKVWIGAQSSPLNSSNLTERHDVEPVPSFDYKEPPISTDQIAVPPASISASSREPVESEYLSSDFVSESSLELDLQVASEPSKTPPMHSMEMNGPASSRGRSSDGSSESSQPPAPPVVMQTGMVDNAPTTNHIRSVLQQTAEGSNSSAKYIPSGTDCSYNRNIAQRALHTNDISLKDSRMDSLEAKISEIGLQQPARGAEGPSSLRGPSLEEGAKNPLKKEATQGNANDVNKLACSKSQLSFVMDASNQVHPKQPQDWSLSRTVDKDGLVKLGRESLGVEVAKNSSAVTQTSGNDEGKQMSVQEWNPPPLGSLIHQSVSASTQTHPVGEDDGYHLSRQSWNGAPHLESGNSQGQSLPNQSVEKTPNEARSDLDRGYKMQSEACQKDAELLRDPKANMAMASGNGGGSQMEIAGNGQSDSNGIHRSSSENHMSTQSKPNGYAGIEASSLRSQDHQDKYPEPMSSMCTNSRSMGLRESGVGEDSPSDSSQYRKQNRQNGHVSNVGALRTNGVLFEPHHCHRHQNGGPQSMKTNYYFNPEPKYGSELMSGRSVSVPSNFRPFGDKEGLFMNNFKNKKNNLEPEASISSSSNSTNYSSLKEKSLVRDLDPDCIKKIKIRLDPLKSIIPDWRNIAGKFGVDSDTINYWKGIPEPGKGPTEHLLEHLRHYNQDLTIDEFKEVLHHYKRYDVLDILKKQNY